MTVWLSKQGLQFFTIFSDLCFLKCNTRQVHFIDEEVTNSTAKKKLFDAEKPDDDCSTDAEERESSTNKGTSYKKKEDELWSKLFD